MRNEKAKVNFTPSRHVHHRHPRLRELHSALSRLQLWKAPRCDLWISSPSLYKHWPVSTTACQAYVILAPSLYVHPLGINRRLPLSAPARCIALCNLTSPHLASPRFTLDSCITCLPPSFRTPLTISHTHTHTRASPCSSPSDQVANSMTQH